MMIIVARQRQRPTLAGSRMEFSTALSNPEAVHHQTNLFLNVGELFFGVFQRGFWDQTLQGSAPFERTPELFCFTMLCTHKILIPIEVTHLYYGVRDMQQ